MTWKLNKKVTAGPAKKQDRRCCVMQFGSNQYGFYNYQCSPGAHMSH